MFYQPGETARHQQYVFDLGPAAQKKVLDPKKLENKAPVKPANRLLETAKDPKSQTPKPETVVQLALHAFSLDAADVVPPTVAPTRSVTASPGDQQPTPSRAAADGDGAEELVREFYRLRYGRAQDPTDREIAEARQFLAEGSGWAKHLVAFAARQGKDKNSFPNDYGGVKKLVSQARGPFEAQRKTAAQAQGREARQSHEKAHTGAYRAFLGSLLGEGVESPLSEAFTVFIQQEQETFRFHRGRAGKSAQAARLVENFFLPETRISRLAKFIQENPQSGLPTFWQWDKASNPTPFRAGGSGL